MLWVQPFPTRRLSFAAFRDGRTAVGYNYSVVRNVDAILLAWGSGQRCIEQPVTSVRTVHLANGSNSGSGHQDPAGWNRRSPASLPGSDHAQCKMVADLGLLDRFHPSHGDILHPARVLVRGVRGSPFIAAFAGAAALAKADQMAARIAQARGNPGLRRQRRPRFSRSVPGSGHRRARASGDCGGQQRRPGVRHCLASTLERGCGLGPSRFSRCRTAGSPATGRDAQARRAAHSACSIGSRPTTEHGHAGGGSARRGGRRCDSSGNMPAIPARWRMCCGMCPWDGGGWRGSSPNGSDWALTIRSCMSVWRPHDACCSNPSYR